MTTMDRKPLPKRVVNESGIDIKAVYTAEDIEASGGMLL